MRIYLGSNYSRRDELNEYAEVLRASGHVVDARWLSGDHEAPDDETTTNGPYSQRAREFAMHDVEDVARADCVVIFTNPPGTKTPRGRGGLHVEYGYAMRGGKRLILVGWRINVFHHMPGIEFYTTWKGVRRALCACPNRTLDTACDRSWNSGRCMYCGGHMD